MKYTRYLWAFFFLIGPAVGMCGDHLPGIRWKFIEADSVKVIYPDGNFNEARRIANVIQTISDEHGDTIGEKRHHLDLLLQTQAVISNGFVTLFPYRSEFYGTALQDFNRLGSLDWLDTLSVHEYRHALQFINARRGLTQFGFILGGEFGWGTFMFLAVPDWFFEGDAVVSETVLTPSGRGRTPSFFNEQKAILFADRNDSYLKARGGSFVDLMPDHYQLGYAMVNHGRNLFGEGVWANILADAGRYKNFFAPFSSAMSRHTGLNAPALYQRTYEALKQHWKEHLQQTPLFPSTQLTASRKTVTHYTWANVANDGSIVAIKSSFKKIPHIVHIQKDKEKTLATLGQTTGNFLSLRGDSLAWTEMSFHPRFSNTQFNNVFSLDLSTGKKRQVTRRSKYFSPHFSVDGKRIVVVESGDDLHAQIVILRAKTGQALDKIPNPTNDFLSYPQWTPDDSGILFLAKRSSKIAILRFDLASRRFSEITPWSHHVIDRFVVGKETVYFAASYSGINNIYATALHGDGIIHQLTSAPIAAEMPAVSPDESTLLVSEFTINGYHLTSQKINLPSAPIITVVEPAKMAIFQVNPSKKEGDILATTPQGNYDERSYSGFAPGTKLHSWGIVGYGSYLALHLRADDILRNVAAGVVGTYNFNENVPVASVFAEYSKYLVPIEIYSAYGLRSPRIYDPTDQPRSSASIDSIDFRELRYGALATLPLFQVSGPFFGSLSLFSGIDQIHTSEYEFDDVGQNQRFDITSVNGGFRFQIRRFIARQNLLPKWGLALRARYASSVVDASALQYAADADIYLPGILANHGIHLRGSWQKENLNNDYRYIDTFLHARGYEPIIGDEEYIFSANYPLPLFYPDASLGFAYWMRTRLNLFFDYSKVERTDISTTFDQNSVGAELLFDVKYFYLFPLALGVQYSYLLNDDYFDPDKNWDLQFFVGGTFF